MSGRIVAILDWKKAAPLKENALFMERRTGKGEVRPRDWRTGSMRYRSLTVFRDGTCLLRKLSAAAVSRQLGGTARIRIKEKRGKKECL